MIRAILIDDEQRALNVLENLLNKANTPIEIVACCKNLESGVEQIKLLKPDVVFLDVQMPNYAGYEIVNFFDKIDFEIIFVTAYDRYALKAFAINAIDYLVKPVDRFILSKTLVRLSNRLSQKRIFVDYHNLLEDLKTKKHTKIVIPELGDRKVIDLRDIIAFEADGSYTKIHLQNKPVIFASKNLKYFEEVLPEDNVFYRSHRAWIVNLEYIEFLNKNELSITLANEQLKAKISRNRLNDFEKTFTF